VRVVTWNVAGRVGAQPQQMAALRAINADVIALQEVTARTAPLWRAALGEAGFAACADALDGLPSGKSRRRLAVLTAEIPWPERVLRCRTGDVEVINVHSPIAPSPELAKIRTHEAVAGLLSEPSDVPRILCGDLNTPRRELPDGTLLTFAHDSKGRLRPERGERWNLAERALVRDLGWIDAYRHLHGYGERSASWTFANDKGGWRLDHLLLDGLTPVSATYAHEWRRGGLSDHSPLIVDVQPPAATTS
jgi:exodeoxyribonuclease-3